MEQQEAVEFTRFQQISQASCMIFIGRIRCSVETVVLCYRRFSRLALGRGVGIRV